MGPQGVAVSCAAGGWGADPQEPTSSVVEALAREIADLPRGSRAPSEADIVARFGIPRSRARRVGDLLEGGLLVQRRQGAGTYVTRPYEYLVSVSAPASLHQMVEASGGSVRTLPVSVRPVIPPEWVAAWLGVDSRRSIVEVIRVGRLDERPAVHLREYFAPGVLDEVAVAIQAIESVEEILRAARADPYRALCRGTVESPPEEVLGHLDLPSAGLAWRVDSLLRDRRGGRPLMVSHNYSRMDAVRLVFDLREDPLDPVIDGERAVDSSHE